MHKRCMKNHKNIENLMKHPIFIGHDANARIIRAQLFFISVATIFIVHFDIQIASDSSVLGIKLKNLTTDHVLWLALILIVYQIIHFILVSCEAVLEWWTRQTALDTGGWGGGGMNIILEDEV